LPYRSLRRALLLLALLLIPLVSLVNLPATIHAGSSDLTVDGIWVEDASNIDQPVTQLTPGQSFNIIATIRNIGQETASGYYLDVYYDSDYGRGGPDNIAPGEVQTWYVGPLTAQDGPHTTKWVVDPDNQIAELNEANNQKDYAFTVGSTTVTTTATSTSSETALPTFTVTFYADPNSGTLTVDGAAMADQVTGTYSSGQRVHVVANPLSGYSFAGWEASGVSVDDQNAQDTYMMVVADGSLRADFTGAAQYTITVNTVVTDGSPLSGAQVALGSESKATDASGIAQFSVSAGTYTLGLQPAVSGGSGIQYVLTQWADGDSQSSRSITVNGPATYGASYKTQYQLTMQTDPSGGATTSPAVGTYWYDSGQTVSIQASPASGYTFRSWTGSGSGSYTGNANPASVSMDGPVTETASLAKPSGAVISGVALAPTSPIQGSKLTFTVKVLNAGATRLSSLTVQVKISGPDGSLVGSASGGISRLYVGAETSVPITYTLPSSATVGAWTYGVYLSRSGTLLDQRTDGSFTVSPIVIAGSVVSVSDTPDPVARRKTVSFSVTINNTGNIAWSSAKITIKIYRPDGTLVASPAFTVKGVQFGAPKTYKMGWWVVPSTAVLGVYHYEVYLSYGSALVASSTDPANTITVS